MTNALDYNRDTVRPNLFSQFPYKMKKFRVAAVLAILFLFWFIVLSTTGRIFSPWLIDLPFDQPQRNSWLIVGTMAVAGVLVFGSLFAIRIVLNSVQKIPLLCLRLNRKEIAGLFPMPTETIKSPKVTLRFLGTAGFSIEAESRLVLIDPYVSRLPLHKLLLSMLCGTSLIPDSKSIDRELQRFSDYNSADILIGHSHFDHILDAPLFLDELIKKGSDARIYGSNSTQLVGQEAVEKSNQAKVISVERNGFQVVENADAKYTPIKSLHGRHPVVGVVNPGEIEEIKSWPTDSTTLKHGTVLDWLIEVEGRSVLHIGSANFIEDELRAKIDGKQIDLLCLCATGWNGAKELNYIRTALEIAQPNFVVPCHWDWIFDPIDLESDPYLMPGLDLYEFLGTVKSVSKDFEKSPKCFFMDFRSEFRF